MKTVYAFDPATRAFIGAVTLDEGDMSPLEPGVYLIPGNCTDAAPPPAATGMEAYLADDGLWSLRTRAVPPPPTPSLASVRRVSMRQARLALHAGGLLSAVDAALDALPADQRAVAKIEWEFAADVERDSALVAMLAAGLGMSDDELDALFSAAAKF